MLIDLKIAEAIRESVREANQPDSAAEYLIAWLNKMSDSELNATEKSQRLNLVYDAIILEELENGDEN